MVSGWLKSDSDLAHDAQLALDRLIGIGVGAQPDRRRHVALSAQFRFEQLAGLGFGEQLGLEIGARRQAEKIVTGPGIAIELIVDWKRRFVLDSDADWYVLADPAQAQRIALDVSGGHGDRGVPHQVRYRLDVHALFDERGRERASARMAGRLIEPSPTIHPLEEHLHRVGGESATLPRFEESGEWMQCDGFRASPFVEIGRQRFTHFLVGQIDQPLLSALCRCPRQQHFVLDRPVRRQNIAHQKLAHLLGTEAQGGRKVKQCNVSCRQFMGSGGRNSLTKLPFRQDRRLLLPVHDSLHVSKDLQFLFVKHGVYTGKGDAS